MKTPKVFKLLSCLNPAKRISSSNGGPCGAEGFIILNMHSHILEECLHLACFLQEGCLMTSLRSPTGTLVSDKMSAQPDAQPSS